LSFNSGKTFKEMLDAAAEIADEKWALMEKPMEDVLDAERDSLRELASEWMRSGLSDKELDARLQKLHQRFTAELAKEIEVEEDLLARAVQAAINSYWKSLMEAL
jgi:hypothetical protein